jgi:hypothetical protein
MLYKLFSINIGQKIVVNIRVHLLIQFEKNISVTKPIKFKLGWNKLNSEVILRKYKFKRIVSENNVVKCMLQDVSHFYIRRSRVSFSECSLCRTMAIYHLALWSMVYGCGFGQHWWQTAVILLHISPACWPSAGGEGGWDTKSSHAISRRNFLHTRSLWEIETAEQR